MNDCMATTCAWASPLEGLAPCAAMRPIKDLVVEIGGNLILDGINLEVGEGEFFSLLGSSGCGKSTLLKTMAGLQPEKAGEILMGEVKLHCLAPQKRGMVIMFQEKRLFTNMDVAENVAFALRNKGVKKAERRVAAEKYLDMVQARRHPRALPDT